MISLPPEPRFSVNWREGEKLAELARGKYVLEIGAFKGHSTLILGNVAEHVVSVDTFTGGEAVEACEGDSLPDFFKATEALRDSGKLTTIVGDSTATLRMLELDAFGFIFHDAAHDFESVKRDLGRIMRHDWRGMLAVHDYGTEEGTKEACDALGLVPVEVVDRLAVFDLSMPRNPLDELVDTLLVAKEQFDHMNDIARVPLRFTNAQTTDYLRKFDLPPDGTLYDYDWKMS